MLFVFFLSNLKLKTRFWLISRDRERERLLSIVINVTISFDLMRSSLGVFDLSFFSSQVIKAKIKKKKCNRQRTQLLKETPRLRFRDVASSLTSSADRPLLLPEFASNRSTLPPRKPWEQNLLALKTGSTVSPRSKLDRVEHKPPLVRL